MLDCEHCYTSKGGNFLRYSYMQEKMGIKNILQITKKWVNNEISIAKITLVVFFKFLYDWMNVIVEY